MIRSSSDRIGKCIFFTASLFSVVAIIAVFGFLITNSLPFFQKIGLREFLLGTVWSPDRYDTYQSDSVSGSYGIFPMLIGTLLSGASALLLGGTLGCFFAIFLVFFCPAPIKRFCNTVVLLLAGIPSVVYGFFGISFLLPKLSRFSPTNGSGLLATSLILGTMILPTVVALYRTALEAVPKHYYTGAVGLGATHVQAVFCTVVPAARSGKRNALILGLGRALGETMAVILVAGNAPTYPKGLFRSFRVLTANIAMEMGYAGEVQEGALIATGCVLLGLIFLVNRLSHAQDSIRTKKNRFRQIGIRYSETVLRCKSALTALSVGFVALIPAAIFIFLLSKGVPVLIEQPSLLYGGFAFGKDQITLLPSLVATVMTVILSLAIAVPVGVMTAVYLREYASKNAATVRIVESAIGLLNGVPSIVYGLFGMISFVPIFGGSASILAGSLTVSILLLPTVTRATEESLSSVEVGQREGSFALGAGQTRTVLKIVLPAAFPGILSAIFLSIGRVLCESAPFLYTMGSVLGAIPQGYLDSGTTLASALYQLAGEGWHIREAYAASVVLIVLVLALNFLTAKIAVKLQKNNYTS